MIELRQYQKDCLDANMEAIKKNIKKIGNVLSTGGGKTEIFIELCNKYLTLYPNKKCLILSHLSVLTTQTNKRIKKSGIPFKCGILQASKKPEKDCKIIVSTMQTSRVEDKIDNYFKDRSEVGLIIVDEVHLIQTNSYEKVIGYFPEAIVNGWTASPFRDAYLMTNYFNIVAYSISMQSLIDQKYLVPPVLNQIVLNENDNSDIERMSKVLKIYNEKEKDKPAVVFMNTMENAAAMAASFYDNGTVAKVITGDIKGDVRDNILDDFKEGKVKILTTCNVLSAGVDLPLLEVIFMPYATSSPTQFLQRCGRALRTHPGKENARIYLMGQAPSIKRGLYQKIYETMLKVKEVVFDDPENAYDELDLMEENNDRGDEYIFTKKVVDAAKRFKSMNYTDIENMLIHHKFPNRFMNIIDVLSRSVDTDIRSNKHEPATEPQRKTLKLNGFNDIQINELNKSSASVLISGFMNMRKQALEADDGILMSGKFIGKHVKDIPYFYKEWVLRNQPHSVVGKMITKFGGGNRYH